MRGSSTLRREAQLIGAVLGNPDFYRRAALLPHEAFNDQNFATLWKFIEHAARRGEAYAPAALAVRHERAVDAMGGMPFLNRLVAAGSEVVTVFNEVVDKVHEDLQWRRVAEMAARLNMATNDREGSPTQVMADIERIAKANLSDGRLTMETKRDVARRAVDAAREAVECSTTGIDSLDYMMQGGVQKRRLYGFGGEFGRGKTILLGTISDNLDLQSVPHLFLSLETPPEDIELRSCAKHMNLNVASIYDSADEDHAGFVASADDYIDAIKGHTYYDYCPQATLDEIVRKILAAKAAHGIEGFILDYWQLIRGRKKGQSEDEHLGECSDRLAALCRQENLWGMVSAQVDERGRLRKSDALYQSASLYVRLCREDNENRAWFVTEKSNYTRYTDNGNEATSMMFFDDGVGPQFRNTEAVDAPAIASQSEDRIEL